MNGNRPMLESDQDEEEDNRMKLRFVKKFLSKEIDFDNDTKNDCKDIFDKIEINDSFLNGGQKLNKKKSKVIYYNKKGSKAMQNESQNFYSEINNSDSDCTDKISKESSMEGNDDPNILDDSNLQNDINSKKYFNSNKKNIIDEIKNKRNKELKKNKINNSIRNNETDSSIDIENNSNYFNNNISKSDSDTNIISDDENINKSKQNITKNKKLRNNRNLESSKISKKKKSKECINKKNSQNSNHEETEILTDNDKIKKKIKTKIKTINEEGEEISIFDESSISQVFDGDLGKLLKIKIFLNLFIIISNILFRKQRFQ